MEGFINFDGSLSGSIAGGGGGGGSEVTITPTLQSGTKIADYSIDEESGSLYAPTPEALPSTIVTKALRKYNDDTQTKILTITTLDTSNNQEVSQDIYAPSPVACWYTPGLEQDYVIGQFTYGGVTQNVYIPNFQRPLTAGTNITIDQDNVISASGGGSSAINYSLSEQDTGIKWYDGRTIYQKTIEYNNSLNNGNYVNIDNTINTSLNDVFFLTDLQWSYSGYIVGGQNTATAGINLTLTPSGISLENQASVTGSNFRVTVRYCKIADR